MLDILQPEFPGFISIPKLRLLESDGLVTPERTPAGYRKFSYADVERLRYVLRMQRDHYLPKRVIAEHLDAMDRGLEPPEIEPVVPTVPEVALSADGMPTPEAFLKRDGLRLSRRELIKTAEISEELLVQLESFGLVSANRAGHYDRDALGIVSTAKQLAEFGIEPRHLRGFKAAADREVGLVEQIVAPRLKASDAEVRDGAERTAAELAALSVKLHATLVKAGLRRL
ncbi:MerR family transcriptional regulator [Nocardioides sp.]|uniref:transcriptional regulator FtsR n=1 Tax=Nocardioides sp. TaxID=35761 RepID=UPI0039E5142E